MTNAVKLGIERTPYGWFRIVNLTNPKNVPGYAFRYRYEAEEMARVLRIRFATTAVSA